MIIAWVVMLFFITDPLGNIPLFMSALKNVKSSARKRFIIIRENVLALLILSLFIFFGKSILTGIGIEQSALLISGGVIMFLIALKMIFPSHDHEATDRPKSEPFLVPLAMPFIAGGSSISSIIILSAQYPTAHLSIFLAVIIVITLGTLILLCGQFVQRILGKQGMVAVERLMGLILITMSIQAMLSGIVKYIHTIT